MRLMEVGTKKLKSDEKDLAKSLFAKSYELYSLFWGINLGLVEIPDIRNNSQDGPEITLQNDNSQNISKTKVNIFSRLGEIVNKILDCCRE